jgi:hypothetical protein
MTRNKCSNTCEKDDDFLEYKKAVKIIIEIIQF